MKKTFTKLFSTALLIGLTVIGLTAKAQSTLADNGAVQTPVVNSLAPAVPLQLQQRLQQQNHYLLNLS